MVKRKKKSTAVAKRETGTVAVAEVFSDAGLGFENAGQEAYAIPFITILQKLSPQLDKEESVFIKGAKEGQFFNTATGEVYDKLSVVPCLYNRQFVEWQVYDQGGGFRGTHDPESINTSALERNDRGEFVLPNGNVLVDTRYHFCLHLTEHGPESILFSMTSTQLKISRNWMTAMSNFRAINPATKKQQNVSMMACIYTATTVSLSNDKGKWKGFKIDFDRMLKFPAEQNVYLLAKEFHNQIATGKAKAEPKQNTPEDSPIF